MNRKQEGIGAILTAIFCAVLMMPHFYYFIFYPNQKTTTISGDGLITYYQMIYHVKYGSGTHLSSMNYPTGEYLFMTDGNGMFTLLYKYISDYLYDISDMIPGVHTYMILISIVIGCVLLYYILRNFHVAQWIAILTSPIIILMSPQMLRIIPHYSQPFLLVIPLAILWFLRKTRKLRIEKRDVLIWCIFIFFFLNNSYIGVISLGSALSMGLIYLVLQRQKYITYGLLKSLILPIISIVALVYVILKVGDPYDDRLQLQWGFFAYNMELRGLFLTRYSLLRPILKNFINYPEIGYEQSVNLGIVPMLLSIIYIIKKLIKRITLHLGVHHQAMFIAALFLFLFSYNSNLWSGLEYIGESYLGPLIMFKASARFSWPLYFVVSILAVRLINYAYDNYNKSYITPILILLVFGWFCEMNWFLNHDYMETRYTNPFKDEHYEKVVNSINQNSIDTSTYQAMYMVPIVQAWHDNYMTKNNYFTQNLGLRLSEHTGIPMINAMLSRMSTSVNMRSIQLASSSYIKKDILKILPNRKPILLILGQELFPLSKGEKELVEGAEVIYKDENFSLLRLDIGSIEMYSGYNDYAHKIAHNAIGEPQFPYIHRGYDNDNIEVYYGKAAELLEESYKKRGLLDSFTIQLKDEAVYNFSIWNKVNAKHYGATTYFVNVSNADFDYSKIIESREEKEVDGLWIKSEEQFHLPKGKNKIIIEYLSRRDALIDELLFYNEKDTMVFKSAITDEVLVNGYKILPSIN